MSTTRQTFSIADAWRQPLDPPQPDRAEGTPHQVSDHGASENRNPKTTAPPISAKQQAANQRNAQKSTGPRTEDGKARLWCAPVIGQHNFVKSFYKDHVQRYKKRPIYWLFSSPKGTSWTAPVLP